MLGLCVARVKGFAGIEGLGKRDMKGGGSKK